MLWFVIALIASAALAFGLMGYLSGLSRVKDVEWAVPYVLVVILAFIASGVFFNDYSYVPLPAAWVLGVIVGRVVRATRS